jgi:hypothetical protein
MHERPIIVDELECILIWFMCVPAAELSLPET